MSQKMAVTGYAENCEQKTEVTFSSACQNEESKEQQFFC